MKHTGVLLASALFVGVAAGYLVGKNSASGANGDDGGADGALVIRGSSQNRDGSRGANASATDRPRTRVKDFSEILLLQGTANRIQAMMDYYQGISVDQFENEANKLENLPSSVRMMAGALLFSRWGEVDPMAAMNYTKTMGFASMMVRPTVLQSWASVDPVNAANYVERNPNEFKMMRMFVMEGRRSMFSDYESSGIIGSEWAKQDPDGAIKWAAGLENGKRNAYSAIVAEVAKTDPARAVQLLSKMDPSDAQSSYASLAASYGSKNFQEAQSWIQSLPADQQESARAAAISGLAKVDANEAAKQVMTLAAGQEKDLVVQDVVSVMARENPQAAADFLLQNGGQDAQVQSMSRLVTSWTGRAPEAALNFVQSLPEGDVRDQGVSTYIWTNRSAPVSELVQVAETISESKVRDRMVGAMVKRWMREDKDAAKAYIEKSTTLPEGVKERYLQAK